MAQTNRLTLKILDYNPTITLNLRSPLLLDFNFFALNTPEMLEKLSTEKVISLHNANPVICRIELGSKTTRTDQIVVNKRDSDLKLRMWIQLGRGGASSAWNELKEELASIKHSNSRFKILINFCDVVWIRLGLSSFVSKARRCTAYRSLFSADSAENSRTMESLENGCEEVIGGAEEDSEQPSPVKEVSKDGVMSSEDDPEDDLDYSEESVPESEQISLEPSNEVEESLEEEEEIPESELPESEDLEALEDDLENPGAMSEEVAQNENLENEEAGEKKRRRKGATGRPGSKKNGRSKSRRRNDGDKKLTHIFENNRLYNHNNVLLGGNFEQFYDDQHSSKENTPSKEPKTAQTEKIHQSQKTDNRGSLPLNNLQNGTIRSENHTTEPDRQDPNPIFQNSDAHQAYRNSINRVKIFDGKGPQDAHSHQNHTHDHSNDQKTSNPNCVICYTEKEIPVKGVLDCGHSFCYGCIVKWSERCNTCPLCKEPFTRIIKRKHGENIDYAVIKQWGYVDDNDQVVATTIENTDETCYKCGEVGDTNKLLVCDNCNFRCAHIDCLDPPLKYIPQQNWYCDVCCEKEGFNNDGIYSSPPIIFPEDYRQRVKAKKRRRRSSTPGAARRGRSRPRRRRRTERDELNEQRLIQAMIEYRMMNKQSRADRAKARRQRAQQRYGGPSETPAAQSGGVEVVRERSRSAEKDQAREGGDAVGSGLVGGEGSDVVTGLTESVAEGLGGAPGF